MTVRRVPPLPFSAFPDLMGVLDGRRTGDGIPQVEQLEVGDAELRFDPEDVLDRLGDLQSMEHHLPIVCLPRDVMKRGEALPHHGIPGIEIDTLEVALILSVGLPKVRFHGDGPPHVRLRLFPELDHYFEKWGYVPTLRRYVPVDRHRGLEVDVLDRAIGEVWAECGEDRPGLIIEPPVIEDPEDNPAVSGRTNAVTKRENPPN